MSAGLGRLHIPDPRDHDHLIPLRRAAAREITCRTWTDRSPVLDQGNTSECTVHAGDKYLTLYPVCNVGFGSKAERTRVYKEVQKLDQWPGEDYDGTSVRAVFKYLQKVRGALSGYQWAFSLEPAVNHILTTGPLVLGTNWYASMGSPDRWGYIWPGEGEEPEGHAYVGMGANRLRKNPDGSMGAVRIINSWGDRWAQKGRAWMTFKVLARLIEEDGEAGCGVEIKTAA